MRAVAHDTMARALLGRLLAAFVAAFVATHATVAALALAFLRAEAPTAAWRDALALAFDVLVAGLDVTLIGCVAAAACVVVQGAAAHGQLLAASLAGRAPWRPFWLGGAAVATLGVALAWWVGGPAPQAFYRLRFPVEDAARAARLVPDGAAVEFGGMSLAVGAVAGEEWRDIALARTDAATAFVVAAASAKVGGAALGAASATLDLDFQRGRLLARDRKAVGLDVAFDRLVASTDARALARPPKSRLLPLQYYRDDELPRYREQVLASLAHGVPLRPAEIARSDAIGIVRWLRVVAATQPFAAFAVVVWLLARPRARRRLVVVAACVAIAAGLVVRIALEARAAKAGDLASPWWALLPLLATVAVAAPFAGRGGRA